MNNLHCAVCIPEFHVKNSSLHFYHLKVLGSCASCFAGNALFQCPELVYLKRFLSPWFMNCSCYKPVNETSVLRRISNDKIILLSLSLIFLCSLIDLHFILLSGSTRNHQILHSERKKRVELICKPQYVWILPEPLSCLIWMYNFNKF